MKTATGRRGFPVGCPRELHGLRVAFVALLGMGVLIFGAWPAHAQIQFQSGPTIAQARTPQDLEVAITELAVGAGKQHIIVQFEQPVTAEQKTALKRSGVELLSYLGDNAFFASMAADRVDARAVAWIPGLVDARAIDRVWKLHPAIVAHVIPDHAIVDDRNPGNPIVAVYLLFHQDVDLATTGVNVASDYAAEIVAQLESINGLVLELPRANIEALADEDAVQWIEWPLPRMSEINDSNREITEANIVQAAPYNLDGSGVTVLVYDGGYARASHVDFEGRLTVRDTSGLSNHSTHVAGTVGGAGVANSAYKGMAPGVTIESYGFEVEGGLQPGFLYTDPGDLEADYDEAINVYGADISNNSIGSNVESNGYDCTWQGDYGVTGALIDAIAGGSLGAPFRIVWAAGNERQGSRCDVEGYGDYYSVAPPGAAKNHITVGALNSNDDSMTYFSSWGPVDDGRMKPDISGPGCQSGGDGGVTSCSSGGDTSYTTMCGTSMASPTVCGLCSLLLEDFRAQFPTEPDPRNSTLKILLAHNAVDLGNTGPDYQYGYGSVRIQQTIDFMRTGNFLEDQVDQAGTFSVLVLVNPGDPVLKVTLAWDDVPGTPNVNPVLVNDLDLRVFDPLSQQYHPWTLDPYNPGDPAVQTQADHLNNIEQVYVASPAEGVWRVEVHGYNVPQGPQSFSLCASPQLIACSSQGTIALDSSLYACSDTAEIQVNDCDLNTDNNLVETVTVTIASDSEPGGESVLLTETGAETADFRGTIPLNTTNSAGVLLVTNGDTVTATYIDADDGQGGTNVTVTATATVDCVGPVISNVQVADIGSEDATVTFDTDERATGTVRYGLACGALTESVSESSAGTSHTLVLTGLTDGTLYYFAVDAVDEQGNPSTDDNGGSCYSFSTLDVVYSFLMDTDPGWTTEGLWAWGQPTGGGGQYGEPDPTSGYTGSNVYGYNLNGDYENYLADTHLTSTAIDCTGLLNVDLKFWRWLGVEQPLYDHAYVRVSNNGSSWTTIWENPTEITDSSWTMQEFDISAIADNQPTVYLRWTMGPTDVGWQYCGWNIDDVQIMALGGVEPTCDDGILNQGEDRIDCGGPCPPCDCLADGQCDDGLYCTGTETCDAYGHCQPGSDPCPGQYCDEDTDSCVECLNDGHCDDGLYCNGAETCVAGTCQPGTDPCPGQGCDEVNDVCTVCDNDGTCEPGEDCHNCPNDCFQGPGAVCGNDVCETPDGEDCVSCPDDCNRYLTGAPGGRYCCGDGTAKYGVTCDDPRCTDGGNTCTTDPAVPSCCGDGVCEGTEDVVNCAVDCACETNEDCDDLNECTDNLCVDGVCQFPPVADNTPCTGGICCGGTCTAPVCSSDLDCDDQEVCTDDLCLNPDTCSAECQNTWPACGLADDCCGPDCTPENDPDCVACGEKNDPCSAHEDCCSGECNLNSGKCK